jgi:hypothetical protein
MVMSWPVVQHLHSQAAADFASAAERIPSEKWLVPRAEGKWCPAQLLEHLNLVYDVLLRELAGGAGMQIRRPLWMRIVLRLTVMPRILRGAGFPPGAPAPRETRPAMPAADQAALIAAFKSRAARLDSAAAQTQGSGAKLTHAYFGRASVEKAVLLCARHIEHHHKQLPSPG